MPTALMQKLNILRIPSDKTNIATMSSSRLSTIKKPQIQQERLTGVALLPYQRAISHKNSRLLSIYNIRTIHIPAREKVHLLRPVKEKLGLKVAGIYCIPCKCGKAYEGHTV